MGILSELLKRKEATCCENCGNLVVVNNDCWGCKASDKLILPNYPPFQQSTTRICENFLKADKE